MKTLERSRGLLFRSVSADAKGKREVEREKKKEKEKLHSRSGVLPPFRLDQRLHRNHLVAIEPAGEEHSKPSIILMLICSRPYCRQRAHFSTRVIG